jgi:hypothetical protein
MKLSNLFFKTSFLILFFGLSVVFAENTTADTKPAEEPVVFSSSGNVQLLNKNTAKVEKIFLQLKKPIIINNLQITLHKCWQAPEYQKPESKMLLEVAEIYQDTKKLIFFGWLFASSPSVSSLEHPIYDLVALNCLKK